ncbi:hypothetical protein BC835DRAFT_1416401 [Cytidiella melzeri]|nr:hypothetical protein BC835DRAFT_1416401 [Cytidiella melzeri]
MATTLPSFVELMASLGLENNKDVKDEQPLNRHSRSSSYSSTSSFISQSSASANNSQAESSTDGSPLIVVSPNPSRDAEFDRRRYRARFSPYVPAISHTRRVSMPDVVREEQRNIRSSSSSPRSGSPSHNFVGHRSSTLNLSSSRRPDKLVLDHDFMANTPISTFLRRKTPQSSPISPTFPHSRIRSSSPSPPVSIPTLPTFCFPLHQNMVSGNVSSDTDDDRMSDASSTHLHVDHRRKPRTRKPLSKKDASARARRPRSGTGRSIKHRLAQPE